MPLLLSTALCGLLTHLVLQAGREGKNLMLHALGQAVRPQLDILIQAFPVVSQPSELALILYGSCLTSFKDGLLCLPVEEQRAREYFNAALGHATSVLSFELGKHDIEKFISAFQISCVTHILCDGKAAPDTVRAQLLTMAEEMPVRKLFDRLKVWGAGEDTVDFRAFKILRDTISLVKPIYGSDQGPPFCVKTSKGVSIDILNFDVSRCLRLARFLESGEKVFHVCTKGPELFAYGLALSLCTLITSPLALAEFQHKSADCIKEELRDGLLAFYTLPMLLLNK